MKSIGTASGPATAANDAALPLFVAPGFLVASFATVPDPRRRRGTRYRLAAILALAGVAILSNGASVLAIARCGADAPLALSQALGFPDGQTPRQPTFPRLFAQLNPDAVVAALAHAGGQVVPAPTARASQGVAIDGKARRGRLAADPAAGAVRSLSAYCHDLGGVLSRAPIAHATDKAEAELPVTPEVSAAVDWHNRVRTGDALVCQRNLSRQVREAGGDGLIRVKATQGPLCDDLRLLFEPPDPSATLTDRRDAATVDHGHGRSADTRRLIASTDPVGYLDWPDHAQVFRLGRTWAETGTPHRAVRYGITGRPPQVAGAADLLGCS